MNVFISWSGNRSHAVAKILRDWVSVVVQAAKPWLSSADIDRGAVWMSDINTRLQQSTVGIFCLTEENKNAPWILFEAGAVAKGVESSRICTFLIDLVPTAIAGPLGQFNHTLPSREGMMNLASTLNRALGESKLSDAQLLRSFEAHWPAFETDFAKALDDNPTNAAPAPAPKTDDVLAEILATVRGLSNRVQAVEERPSDPDVNAMSLIKALRKYGPTHQPGHGVHHYVVAQDEQEGTAKGALARLFDEAEASKAGVAVPRGRR